MLKVSLENEFQFTVMKWYDILNCGRVSLQIVFDFTKQDLVVIEIFLTDENLVQVSNVRQFQVLTVSFSNHLIPT